MKKYNVLTDTCELKRSEVLENGVEGAYFMQDQYEPTSRGLFDTLEEAKKALNAFTATVETCDYGRVCRVTVAYIEEAEYEFDEELGSWEFVDGSDYFDFFCEELAEEDED